jgi:hypothetical protein
MRAPDCAAAVLRGTRIVAAASHAGNVGSIIHSARPPNIIDRPLAAA